MKVMDDQNLFWFRDKREWMWGLRNIKKVLIKMENTILMVKNRLIVLYIESRIYIKKSTSDILIFKKNIIILKKLIFLNKLLRTIIGMDLLMIMLLL